MAKDLEEALTNIEKKLGGAEKPELRDLGEYLYYIESLIDGRGGSDLPPIEAGDAGKVVKVNSDETGFEYSSVSGGTKLYKKTITFTWVLMKL